MKHHLGLQHIMTVPFKIKKPNRLNYFGVRKADAAPPHFEYITIPLHYNLEDAVIRWIQDNLKGRFYVGRTLRLISPDRSIDELLEIGFEEAKELSYFTLACPHLKY